MFRHRRAVRLSLALAGVCAVSAACNTAHAAIIYSGAVNVAVPATTNGGYINLATFAVGTTFASVNGGDAAAPVLNLWGTTASRAWLFPNNSTVNRFVSDAAGTPLELAEGFALDLTSTYGTSTTPAALTTGGAWTGGTTGYLGFKFLNGATTEFGWAQISIPAGAPTAGNQIRLLGIAYDNTGAGIAAGAVPEPGTLALLAAGAVSLGVVALRRRKVA